MAPRIAAASTIHGKADVEDEDADEGQRRHAPQHFVLQRARADAPGGEQHHRHHRRLDAVENALHQRHVAPGEIDARQQRQQQKRGQEKQHAGDDRRRLTPCISQLM